MVFRQRRTYTWRTRSRELALGRRTAVIGVLNVTPDSFSEGGTFPGAEAAAERALAILDDGADVLDLGGESTRPGVTVGAAAEVSAQQEIDRVLPVIERVLQARPRAVISIDTYKAVTALAAVEAGAEIVNDVSGFLWDAAMAETCAALGCGVVLMHTRGTPDEWRTLPRLAAPVVTPLVARELGERLQAALQAGVARARIALDPGYGFGKRLRENYALLAHQEELRKLGLPLLAGVSRKSFLGLAVEERTGEIMPPAMRGNVTLAGTVAAVLAGAHMVRVHEVRAAVEAVAVADAILEAAL